MGGQVCAWRRLGRYREYLIICCRLVLALSPALLLTRVDGVVAS